MKYVTWWWKEIDEELNKSLRHRLSTKIIKQRMRIRRFIKNN